MPCNLLRRPRIQSPEVDVMFLRLCRLSLLLFLAFLAGAPAPGESQNQRPCPHVRPFSAGLYQYRDPIAPNPDGSVPEQTVVTATIHSPQPIKAVYSPSHNVAVSRSGEHDARVSAESDSSG